MIRKSDIIAAARAIIRSNKGYRLPMLIHPRRDWWIGLIVFGIIVIGGSLVLARMYIVFQSVDQLVGVEASQIPRYQAEIVRDVNVLYASRQAVYNARVSAAFERVTQVAVSLEEVATSTEAVQPDIVEDSEEGSTSATDE